MNPTTTPVSSLLLFIVLVWCLTGCGMPPTPDVSAVVSVAITSSPRRTPRLTTTSTPLATGELTATVVSTGTRTTTPTLNTDFWQAKIAGVSFTRSWQLIVSLETYFLPTGSYYALIEGPDRYFCEKMRGRPFHIYCSGPQVPVEQDLVFQLFDAESEKLVYEESFVVPLEAALAR
jgi:hypothetical protein